MAISPGTHTIGPDGCTLKINTYREGLAAKVGHDLVIEVTDWEATVAVGEDGALGSVTLRADPGSLQVREGHGGAKPLTDKDRNEIRKTIGDKVLGSDPITFSSSAASVDDSGRMRVEGDLAIAGNSRPASFELMAQGDGAVGGTMQVTQSDWGIKPYRGLMGALKVRDSVDIVLDARLPGA